jgi:hypothetical protein
MIESNPNIDKSLARGIRYWRRYYKGNKSHDGSEMPRRRVNCMSVRKAFEITFDTTFSKENSQAYDRLRADRLQRCKSNAA